MPRRPVVAVVHESTAITAAEVTAFTKALQHQVDHDFEPAWGAGCHLYNADEPSAIPDKDWQLVFLDDADQADALGYHDLTPARQPLGKVFVKTAKADGASPSVTASHELLEMIADPHLNRVAIDPRGARLYAYESADAVEADELGYEIDGVRVSDFVTDAWFDPQARGVAGVKFDREGHLSAPFELAPGGYISYLDLRDVAAGWKQARHTRAAKGARPAGFPPGSRRERRKRLATLRASNPREAH